MYEIIPMGGDKGGEAFLLTTPEKTALIDNGFAHSADKLVENLTAALDGRSLDYIILSHTHYDHCSGTPWVTEKYPDAKIIAGAYSARVFSRPGAIKTIIAMNEAAAQERGLELSDEAKAKLTTLHADIVVSEGDIIDLGSMKLKVIETPGHTKCSIALYCEAEKLLISSETLCLYTGRKETIWPCFLVGYEVAVNSIKKVMELDIDKILFPHLGVHSGKEIDGFFPAALICMEKTKDKVIEAYKNGARGTALTDVLADMFYDDDAATYQPRAAFDLNAKYMVQVTIRECLGIEDFVISDT